LNNNFSIEDLYSGILNSPYAKSICIVKTHYFESSVNVGRFEFFTCKKCGYCLVANFFKPGALDSEYFNKTSLKLWNYIDEDFWFINDVIPGPQPDIPIHKFFSCDEYIIKQIIE